MWVCLFVSFLLGFQATSCPFPREFLYLPLRNWRDWGRGDWVSACFVLGWNSKALVLSSIFFFLSSLCLFSFFPFLPPPLPSCWPLFVFPYLSQIILPGFLINLYFVKDFVVLGFASSLNLTGFYFTLQDQVFVHNISPHHIQSLCWFWHHRYQMYKWFLLTKTRYIWHSDEFQ